MKTRRKIILIESKEAQKLRALIRECYDLTEKIKHCSEETKYQSASWAEYLERLVNNETSECEIFVS